MPKPSEVVIPPRVIENIRSDIRSYLRGGYTFAEFLDRNNYGRRYGRELKKLWKEEEKAYAQMGNDQGVQRKG